MVPVILPKLKFIAGQGCGFAAASSTDNKARVEIDE